MILQKRMGIRFWNSAGLILMKQSRVWLDSPSIATSYMFSLKFFEPQYLDSESRPTKRQRVFGRANSGRLFEAAQAADPDSSPLIAMLAFDKSYSGQTQGYHPIYCNMIMHFE